MRFDDNTVMCERCMRNISDSQDCGNEDESLCPGCAAREMQEHVAKICEVCNEALGEAPCHYNTEDNETLIHSECVMNSKDPDIWSDDYY